MSNITTNKICKRLSQINDSEWITVKFKKDIPANYSKPVRFCEAVSMAYDKDVLLSPLNVCCDGAKRCFGWMKDYDSELARRLSLKVGISEDKTKELIKSVPVLPDIYAGIFLSKNISGDVYISYLSPCSAMKFIRTWQKTTCCSLYTGISSVMSVCGNVAVRAFVEQQICISFGCPDSREYGGLMDERLVIGIPHDIACSLIAT